MNQSKINQYFKPKSNKRKLNQSSSQPAKKKRKLNDGPKTKPKPTPKPEPYPIMAEKYDIYLEIQLKIQQYLADEPLDKTTCHEHYYVHPNRRDNILNRMMQRRHINKFKISLTRACVCTNVLGAICYYCNDKYCAEHANYLKICIGCDIHRCNKCEAKDLAVRVSNRLWIAENCCKFCKPNIDGLKLKLGKYWDKQSDIMHEMYDI